MNLRALFVVVLLTAHVHAAKVIMKDGKIHEGRIVAETDGDVLIKISPVSRSKLLLRDDILSVVRDPETPEPKDPQRYAALESLLTGNVFDSENISLEPAAGLWLGGGLRLHPVIELGAGFDWKPALAGELAITDGATTRRYERFAAYTGGFSAKFFPFYRLTRSVEPFLLFGYEWSRLAAVGSGDALKGQGFKGGFGAHLPLGKTLFWQSQLIYRHITYDRVFFLLRDGTLDPDVTSGSYSFSTGLAWHL